MTNSHVGCVGALKYTNDTCQCHLLFGRGKLGTSYILRAYLPQICRVKIGRLSILLIQCSVSLLYFQCQPPPVISSSFSDCILISSANVGTGTIMSCGGALRKGGGLGTLSPPLWPSMTCFIKKSKSFINHERLHW